MSLTDQLCTVHGEMVCVADFSRWRHQGACTCRWRGRRRWMVSIAVLDALGHALSTGHTPTYPLVIPAARRPIPPEGQR
ncbi:hypothetical protein [Mycobacterium hubeiense]|uniref:hypothetical protein n=1 Tax=Mycobacterium hubeiense TaxID=1867256 RepID=UPI00115C311D|nr:hypothetical protein [Mycobacterium sp. QGD 101]